MLVVTVDFLTVEDVLAIHEQQIERFGGTSGLRDSGLLESAVAQPQMAFGGDYLHDGLFAMAAAYLFHLASNHPFVDGNKRIGLSAALVFLDINGVEIVAGTEDLYDLTMLVAQGESSKALIEAALERLA